MRNVGQNGGKNLPIQEITSFVFSSRAWSIPDSLYLVLLWSNHLINDVVTEAVAKLNHTFTRFCRQFGEPEPSLSKT